MFDLLVIGGGPGGYHAALKAAAKGLTVALIEKNTLGGVCLNRGCIPTKTLLHSSKLLKDTTPFAVHHSGAVLDMAQLQRRKESVLKSLGKSLAALIKQSGITLVEGAATLVAVKPHFVVGVGEELFKAKQVVLATGSTPVVPSIPGADLDFVYTSDTILDLEEIPRELIIVGGGVIGLEMASFFAASGSTVTVVEAQSSIGGNLDSDIEKILKSVCKKRGIRILCNTTVKSIIQGCVLCESDRGELELSCDAVLLSVGRTPFYKGLGLEQHDVHIERGAVVTDAQCQTSLAGLYAVGDVNGKWQLAHTAYREAEVAVATLLGEKQRITYEQIPSVIYTAPEVASVGLTEAEAAQLGMTVTVKKRPLGGNGRFLAETHKERGLCKVVLSETGKLLGVQLISPYAAEIISSAAILVQLGITKEQVEHFVLPHPTISEIIKETIVEG